MLDRKVAPDFNKDYSFTLIEPEITSLRNGAEIYFVGGGQQNIIKLELIIDAGKWQETKAGEAYFTANLLSKGTALKSSFHIASEFDQLGAHLEINPGLDNLSISLYSVTSKFKEALTLLMEILLGPAYPEKEFQQIRSIYLQNLKVNQEKTSFLASKLFRESMFGTSHPYGSDARENQIAALEQEDIVLFHKSFFGSFQVFVSGKIEEANRKAILDKFSSLAFEENQPKLHTPTTYPEVKIYQEKDNSVQTSIRVGKRTIGRRHKDYPKLLLLNHILGGYFGSRLMKNIREEKGLTYGIHSSIHALSHDSYLVIGTDVNKENKDLAVDEIRKEITLLRSDLIPNEELDTARFHFIGSLQSDLSTSFAHADKIKNIVIHNLDTTYYTELIDQIASVTNKELANIGNLYLEDSNIKEIAVG